MADRSSDFDDDTERLLEDFAKADLWHKTQVRRITASQNSSGTLGRFSLSLTFGNLILTRLKTLIMFC